MADLWYYTCEGKQMEPVTDQEIKQLATAGKLKPTDMVWKEGMPDWIRASSAGEQLFAEGRTTAPAGTSLPASREVRPQKERQGENRDERARRDFERYADEDEEDYRPRRRRRARVNAGMSTGLKVGLILGCSLLVVVVIGIFMLAVWRSGINARRQFKMVQAPLPPPQIKIQPLKPLNPPFVPPPGGLPQPPVFKGPFPVGPAGLIFHEQLNLDDARDVVLNSPCKVFAINMLAGKTYTIRHDAVNKDLDPYLRLEDSNCVRLAEDDDSGGFLNALLVYSPAQTGTYRVIATSFDNGIENFTLVGNFTLRITEN